MRIAVTGASGVLGRGLTARLLSQGHEVVGIARHRPDSWPSSADFIAADIRDATAVESAMTGADVVAHCAWVRGRNDHINIDGTANVLKAMAETGTGRIVFTSSGHQPRVEQMLADCGLEWSPCAARSFSVEMSTTGCSGCLLCRCYPPGMLIASYKSSTPTTRSGCWFARYWTR